MGPAVNRIPGRSEHAREAIIVPRAMNDLGFCQLPTANCKLSPVDYKPISIYSPREVISYGQED